ncbi:subunit beta (Wbp1) of oligosaccharyltransferase complex [Mitosporidium daphniae]|uniref:Subunit beta (Wbp1) of oligosaccharyltransferase complex n=1 Tax=Mitosporidium daphniae TaxID=1485682 RepID=A0A098VUC9_9MICR|nr:subunit beta (Wbp1) of oligosaccharyltransferase complex [Mitosporidium daphniae]KGG52582.1 subunit beta (Wbp1) of oligosaccharyltransferase complex [Mitosporidium daphniae]|eukprot:XP_013239018.1 subunit beta (Wbp1) of oligosaccharyltransferase complex [Mitosporidium daphniae]
MSNNVKIFDHLDTNIPTLFPNSRSFFNLEKLDPQMVSKIILLGASKISASWSAVELAHFVAIGGQLIIAMPDVKSSSSSFFKEFLSQFGVSFTKFPIVSERYESRQWNQELMDGVFEGNVTPALTYPNQTHGLLLDGNRSVNYLWSLITPEPTSLILNELNATPISCGAITSLIALFQSRYNGRLCILLPLCRSGERAANFEAISGITRWTFKERGMVKASSLFAYADTEIPTPGSPQDKSFRHILATISKYSDGEKSWKPFIPTDLQFELVVMKPYIRKVLSPLHENIQTYPLRIQELVASVSDTDAVLYGSSIIPDRTGISTLRLFYLRKGYCSIDESMTITLRHYAHDEYPTKFVLAYPYYASVFSCLFAIVFVSLFLILYKKPEEKDRRKLYEEKKSKIS